MQLPDEPRIPDEAHDERLPKPGDEVLVYYEDLHGAFGIVRSVIDASQGLLSIRIPFKNIPPRYRSKWISEPGNPTMTPIVLKRGEYVLYKRAGFSAPFRHPGSAS